MREREYAQMQERKSELVKTFKIVDKAPEGFEFVDRYAYGILTTYEELIPGIGASETWKPVAESESGSEESAENAKHKALSRIAEIRDFYSQSDSYRKFNAEYLVAKVYKNSWFSVVWVKID